MKKQHRLKLKPKEGKFLTRALGSDVRGTQSILHVVYFAAHRLICSLVCWLSRTKESGLNVSKDEWIFLPSASWGCGVSGIVLSVLHSEVFDRFLTNDWHQKGEVSCVSPVRLFLVQRIYCLSLVFSLAISIWITCWLDFNSDWVAFWFVLNFFNSMTLLDDLWLEAQIMMAAKTTNI